MKKQLLSSLVVLTAVALPAVVRVHGVWERDATQLIWSQQEAYLVAARLREGWSGNLWEVAWETIRGNAGLSTPRPDRRHWLEVTRITSADTTLTVVPDGDTSFSVFEGHIYGGHGGTIAKWVDGEFVPIDPDERSRFTGEHKGGHFRDVNGWSSELSMVNRSLGIRRYPLALDGMPVEVIVNQGDGRRTVSVQFPGRAPVTILDLPNQSAWVDAATYRRLLSPPPTP